MTNQESITFYPGAGGKIDFAEHQSTQSLIQG